MLVWKFCQRLVQHGIKPGDNVAVLLPNSLAFVTLIYALIRIGARLVPLNTRLTPNELRTQILMTDCSTFICSASMKEVGQAACPETASMLELPDDPDGLVSWLIEQPVRANWQASSASTLDDIQAILFTSGTSGKAKGATLTYANHFWSAIASAFRIGIDPNDRWLSCLPLYHVGGLAILFRSCLYGTTVILHRGFDTHDVMNSIAVHKATLVSLVPTMLYRLLHENHSAKAFGSLRLLLLGGAAASRELLEDAQQAGLPVATTYGLTEAASQVATALPAQVKQKPGSVGRAQLLSRIQIVDQIGYPLPTGEVGEITVTGPTVMAGYYGDDQATRLAIRNSTLFTGDVGYLDSDGDLWVLDRRDDLIVSGGENVYPAEVEAVLRAHPAVHEAVVVGLPHPEWGKQVVAAVVVNHIGAVTQDDLSNYCRDHLAGYKQPKRFFFLDHLPQTGSGKIPRSVVATQLESMANKNGNQND